MLLCWHPQVLPSVLLRRSKAGAIPRSCLRAGRQRVNKQLSQVAEHLSCRERLGTFIELLRWFLPGSSSWCSCTGNRGWGCSEHGQHPWELLQWHTRAMLAPSLCARVFWEIRDVHMVLAASSGVFTWISHWNMDDASTIKCLSPEKGKGEMFILISFLREISFTVKCSLWSFLGHFLSVIQT